MEIEIERKILRMTSSGCDKSTLMKIPGMPDNPTRREYNIPGTDVPKFSDRQCATMRKNNIGFVFQSFNLIDELTVFENIDLSLLYQNVSPADRKQRVNEARGTGLCIFLTAA